MDIVCWARRTVGGKREDQIKAAFRRAGCAVDQHDDPFYVDQPPAKSPPRLDIDHLPELQRAVYSLQSGGQFVVMTLGHFAVPRVWEWVAQHLARKACSLRDLDSARTWDFAQDHGAGYEVTRLVETMANRLRTEKARTAAAAAGKLGPRQKLADPATMERAQQVWADPNLSADKAAKTLGIGVATLYRHLGPKTEFEKKAAKAAEAAVTGGDDHA